MSITRGKRNPPEQLPLIGGDPRRDPRLTPGVVHEATGALRAYRNQESMYRAAGLSGVADKLRGVRRELETELGGYCLGCGQTDAECWRDPCDDRLEEMGILPPEDACPF